MVGNVFRAIIYIVCSIFLLGCSYKQLSTYQDVAGNYNAGQPVATPQFQVLHINDGMSRLFYRVAAQRNYRLQYKIMKTYESTAILDSGTIALLSPFGSFDFQTPNPWNYVVKIKLDDIQLGTSSYHFIEVIKSKMEGGTAFNVANCQNFNLFGADGNTMTFKNYFNTHDTIVISYKRTPVHRLLVNHFGQRFPIATYPFDISEMKPLGFKPDSSFMVALDDSGKVNFCSRKPGLYCFFADSMQKEGCAVFLYESAYPTVTQVQQMEEPLQYITSKEEYTALQLNKNKRQAIEQFWINCGGNKDRAKHLIQKYYSRVKEANVLFHSYIEGWKTDRGMIYIVFGPPNYVYKSSESETWVYGDNANPNAINFNNLNNVSFSFNHIINPFTNNDYYLERSVLYKANWENALDSWRQGKIYLQN